MKSTSVIRKVDMHGKISLPKEVRRKLGFEEENSIIDGVNVEFFVDGNKIILQKYRPNLSCVFCENVTEEIFKGVRVCCNCLDEMKC